MNGRDDANGPIVTWVDYGPGDGWKPYSYDDLEMAVLDGVRLGATYCVTRRVSFKVVERVEGLF